MKHTCSVIRAYMTAYDHHDLTATLSLIDPRITMFDCDYLWDSAHRIDGKKEAAQWLRDRFAEGDQFQGQVMVGGGLGTKLSPLVFFFLGTRTNDALSTRGVAQQSLAGTKGLLNSAGTAIVGLTLGDGRHCSEHAFPPGASAARTKTVAQVFIDAYSAHDLPRTLQLLTKHVSYRDCDFTHHKFVTLHGKKAVKAWLKARFRQQDAFSGATLGPVTGVQPNTVTVSSQRMAGSLGGTSGVAVGLGFVLPGPAFDHIGTVSVSSQCG